MRHLKSIALIISLSVSLVSWAQETVIESELIQEISEVKTGAIDINKANIDELTLLNRIGLKKAQQIIDYRNVHGAFKTIDDLQNVKGIGQSTIDKNRLRMVVVN